MNQTLKSIKAVTTACRLFGPCWDDYTIHFITYNDRSSPLPVGCSVPVGPPGSKRRSLLFFKQSPLPVGCSVPVGARYFTEEESSVRSHHCLSAVRSLLGKTNRKETHERKKSPLPVGCSVPVGIGTRQKVRLITAASPLPVGCSVPVGHKIEGEMWVKHLASPLPVGCSVPVGINLNESSPCSWGVTTACRLFGPCWGAFCASNAVRMKSVTTACRLFGPCWGMNNLEEAIGPVGHHCLSAVRSLLGSRGFASLDC